MARTSARPGRTVAVFFMLLAVAYGLVALVGTWKPALGLDLEGGTQIQLTAKGDNIKKDQLDEAANIIDERVNGSGVTEAEVTTQGSNMIVVQVPGDSKSSLVDTVDAAGPAPVPARCAGRPDRHAADACSVLEPVRHPAAGRRRHSAAVHVAVSTTSKGDKPKNKSTSKGGNNRTPALLGKNKQDPKKHKNGDKPTSSPSSSPTPNGPTSTGDVTYTEANKKAFSDELTWMTNPDPQSVAVYNAYTCPAPGATAKPVDDNPNIPIVTCNDQGQKYLLSPAVIEGTEISSAAAIAPGSTQGQVKWTVSLNLKKAGADEQLKLSQAMVGNQNDLVGIVLDGQVVTATYFTDVIPDGTSQIEGDFTETEAKSLATSLKYGALPITFDQSKQTIQVIGPSLAGDQLSAGITAGIAGLALVMIYCLFYYRGLGLVVIASLFVAAATTYAMVLLLAKSAGFTLTLPGIAGLIVAVGITADSFIVFFERIRDEMRSGKSMRVAVEAGWVRARATCVAADAVSILAAVVLYIFAAGVVKGFAFALGLSTLIDLAVFFWFTHPMVSWLARFSFFNKGHKLSGLDAENLGIDRLPAGGRA